MPPMSHVCASCGTDLARARLQREPHYGLLVVVCPDCAKVYPRSLAPAPVRRRHRWRTPRTIALFILQLAITAWALGTALFIAFTYSITDLIPWGNMPARAIAMQYAVLLVITSAIGAWMTIALPHWSRGLPWLVLATICLCSTLAILGLLTWQQAGPGFASGRPSQMYDASLGRALAGAAMLTLATLPGIPVGLGVRAIWRYVMRAYRRYRRTQLRKAWS